MGNVKHILLALLVTVSLVACGGGGGNTSQTDTSQTDTSQTDTSQTDTSQRVALAGVAAKGILKRAKATAYEVISGELQEVQSVTTDAAGAYSFSLTPTDNPVLVKIETVVGVTKMLDESQIENGAYKEIDAPVGLTVRTMVESLAADRAEINANPFTEMAVSAAVSAKDASGNIKPLDKDSWAAARAVVIQILPAGVTPEAIKPLNITDTPTASQKAVMTMLTGLAASGDVTQAVKSMAESVKLVIAGDGTASMAVGSEAALRTQLTTASAAGVSKLTELAAAIPGMADFIDNTDYSSVTIASVNLAVEASRASLDSFVRAMKTGVSATENTLRTAKTDFDERVAKVSMDMIGGALNGAFQALSAIDVSQDDQGYIVLSTATTCGQDCGFTLFKKAIGTYTITPVDQSEMTGSAEAYGKFNSDGSVTLRYSGSGVKTSDSTSLGDFDLNIAITGLTDGGLDLNTGSIAITSLTVNGVSDDGKYEAHIVLKNGKLVQKLEGQSLTISAENIEISTSDGDRLKGTLTKLRGWQTLYGGIKPRELVASMSGFLKNSQIVKATVNVLKTTQLTPYGTVGEETGTLSLSIDLPGDVSLIIESTKKLITASDVPEVSEKMVLSVGKNSLIVQGYDDGSLALTSGTGAYTATLDAGLNGKLMAGTTQIGEIKKGVLQYDGRTVSLF